MTTEKQIILTGLRANNDLTLGNYLGALLPMVDMAKKRADNYQINLFVPDLHSFTTPIDHASLYEQTMKNLRVYVASGLPIDHQNVYMYRQSYVPAHSELTWVLDCFTRYGELRRMTQFKDKSGAQKAQDSLYQKYEEFLKLTSQTTENLKKANLDEANHENFVKVLGLYKKDIHANRELIKELMNYAKRTEELNASAGLYTYPVLMAADILLYNAAYVPVGDDQTQHLEFARDIAQRMNNQFGELFTVPLAVPKQHEFFGKDQGLRIRDLLDPTKKMSKSDETGRGVIFLSDTPDAAAKKVMSATTDSLGKIDFNWETQPGITNLLQILALLREQPLEVVKTEWIGRERYGELKQAVAEAVKSFLNDFQARFAAVNEAELLQKLEYSEQAMNEAANITLYKVQQAVGLRPKV